ncbi:MAG: hypothetical protein ACTHLW_06580 [Verrucomicrobiota bacterium]
MKLKHFLAVITAVALTFSASALMITPGSASWSGDINSNLSASQLSTILNGAGFGVGSLTELYKQNVGGSESGAYASSYQTTFDNSPGDPQDADIKYISGPALAGFENLWLYVKDGNHDPAYYLINLNLLNWNGTDLLQLRSFWPQQGAISHVTILGNGTRSVPDGGMTVMLLGTALAGLGTVRRFIKR